ncbi:MAG: lytic murein transglycosylase, partial [Gammaproteobacteria bacterium]
IITALIGMESSYGGHEGSFSALSALATLAFDYPRRADYFRRELTNYLVLCRRNHLDPQALKSSYAGALGAGQFMPSSYLAYAVDADGGGSDLFIHWPDIVASIAHYLAAHGWQAGEPVAAAAALKPGFASDNLFGRVVPMRTLHVKGVAFDVSLAADTPVRLVKVATRSGDAEEDDYWVGLPNFSVLMSYNNSALYALAATQLAGALAAAPASADAPLAAGHP